MGTHTIKRKMQAKSYPEDHIADVTLTVDLTGVHTGTDMTSTQAATIVADLTALAAAVASINAALAEWGITKSS